MVVGHNTQPCDRAQNVNEKLADPNATGEMSESQVCHDAETLHMRLSVAVEQSQRYCEFCAMLSRGNAL